MRHSGEPRDLSVDRIRGVLQGSWRRATGVVVRLAPDTLLLTLVVALDVLLVLAGFVATQYLGLDVSTALTFFPKDGFWTTDPAGICRPSEQGLGVHCFGDYTLTILFAARPNPWDEYLGHHFNYAASGMFPHLIFGTLGTVLGSARIGLALYLIALAVAIAAPSIWATRGRSLPARIGVAAATGLISIPALVVLDRGNSVGFIVPVLFALFLALARDRRRLIVAMIILAALVKPQFAVLMILPFLQRRWLDGLLAVAGVGVTNILAYLAWPLDFPNTIRQSLSNTLEYGEAFALRDDFPTNVSFARGLYVIEQGIRSLLGMTSENIWVERGGMLVGVLIASAICIYLLLLGRRMPPVMAAILLAATASMTTTISFSYYLVFAIPVAAVILRDPASRDSRSSGGLLQPFWSQSTSRRIAVIAVVVATAASLTRIIQFQDPIVQGELLVARTNIDWIPLLWLLAIGLALVAWTRASPAAEPRRS